MQLRIHHRHAVRHRLQHALGLRQAADEFAHGRIVGIEEYAVKRLVLEQFDPLRDTIDPDDFAVRAAALQQVFRLVAGCIQKNNSRSCRHGLAAPWPVCFPQLLLNYKAQRRNQQAKPSPRA